MNFDGILDSGAEKFLNRRLYSIQRHHGPAIYVAVIADARPGTADDYAFRAARQWLTDGPYGNGAVLVLVQRTGQGWAFPGVSST
ncbi:MAG: TPM domain-containing protein [Leptospiraceae bacterium]|nr:TPM domain-containing protein [Leptospiraceae bacterium]